MSIRGFIRAEQAGAVPPELDGSQAAVLELPDHASAAVIGAPGTGKTTTLVELVADRVLGRGWSPDDLVVLTPSRAAATRLRDRLAIRLGVPSNGPLARTATSLAFELVRHAARRGDTAPPVLLTGGEQDQMIKELLAGHLEEGGGPAWPEHLGPNVRALRGFRTELRELMMRATEHRISPDRMRALGLRHDRAEWVAAADFITEYLTVLSAAREHAVDAAELLAFACAALDEDEIAESAGRLRLVIIDDLQDSTESTLALLRGFARRGVAIIGFGDPDIATGAFRGGQEDALGRFALRLGIPSARTIVLHTAHRHGTDLRRLTLAVTQRIGTAGAGRQHRALPGRPDTADPAVVRIEEPTPARECAAIARMLREEHLLGGVRFSEMAVIVRSGAQVPGIARALALAGVPSRTTAAGQALRESPAARGLLAVVDTGIGRSALTADLAVELLQGPFGGLDRLSLRRLRLALRTEEIAGGGTRSGDELLVDALLAPGRLATIDHRVGRAADRMAVTLAQVRGLAERGATIEELLWLVWERSALARTWSDQALGAGIGAAEANRNLDAVMAVFTAARRFVERRPDEVPRTFLDAVLDAEVPEDTLAPQQRDDAVLVTTPPGVVGAEFDVVVVAGLQDGAWPNLRVRGSLLHPAGLVDAAAERSGADATTIDERKQVMSDELRMFALAVSRARRRVALSAVVNDDTSPSVFLALAPELDGSGQGLAQRVHLAERPPLSLRGLTGALRRELTEDRRSAAEREAAASALARLAAEGVPGAHPSEWHGLLEASTDEPLYRDDETVPISPSKLEAFERSPLDWFIESVSGGRASTAMGVGTVLHWAMETATDSDVDTLWRAVESRWKELVFEAPWLVEAHKRSTRALVAGIAEYLADFQRDGTTLVAAEGDFQLEVGRALLRGSIDRIERAQDGAVRIVDLKTGNPVQKAKLPEHPQLAAYQLAYAEGKFDDLLSEHGEHRGGGAMLLYVKKGVRGKLYSEGVQNPLTAEQLEGFRQRIRQAAAGMTAAAFTGALEIDEWGNGDAPALRLHRVKAVSSD